MADPNLQPVKRESLTKKTEQEQLEERAGILKRQIEAKEVIPINNELICNITEEFQNCKGYKELAIGEEKMPTLNDGKLQSLVEQYLRFKQDK